MYENNPIQIGKQYEESVEPFLLDITEDVARNCSDEIFTEAVFAKGREQLKPIVEQVEVLKKLLEEEIEKQNSSVQSAREDETGKTKVKMFDPKSYWRNKEWLSLENTIMDIFGFRNVQIHPYIEKYSSNRKHFESNEMNAVVYNHRRFPIKGLVTDKGFYDYSHTCIMEIHISLGLIKNFTSEQIVAVLLHEFGHGIDPALCDISYTETNVLSKYLTDRKNKISKEEENVVKKGKSSLTAEMAIFIFVGLVGILGLVWEKIVNLLQNLFWNKEKKLKQLKTRLAAEKDQFNRQNYSEAFADNFARMYGFGKEMSQVLRKFEDATKEYIDTRIKKEIEREKLILTMTQCMLQDVHKTNIHRVKSLIKEYEEDIKDPKTPKKVKKDLEEDLTELKEVLNGFLNNYSEMQNRVNQLIVESYDAQEKKEEKRKETEQEAKPKDGSLKKGDRK